MTSALSVQERGVDYFLIWRFYFWKNLNFNPLWSVEDINQLSLKEILDKYDFVPIPTEKLGDNTNAKISQLYIEGELEIISDFYTTFRVTGASCVSVRFCLVLSKGRWCDR